MKKMNQKGFTLAELLIVVAVIAVLVAVAIPTFSDQLEKARQSTDVANLRDAYAVARLAELENKVNDTAIKNVRNDTQDKVTYYFNAGTGKLTRYDEANDDSKQAAKDNGTKIRAQTRVLKIDPNESIFYKYDGAGDTGRITVGPADAVMKYLLTVDATKAILKVTFQETGKDTFDFILQSVSFVDPDAGSWNNVDMTAVEVTGTGDAGPTNGGSIGTAPTAPSDPYGEVTYAKTQGPDWLVVNPTTGAMTTNKDLTSADNTTSPITTIITATDDNGKTGTYTFTITVNITA